MTKKIIVLLFSFFVFQHVYAHEVIELTSNDLEVFEYKNGEVINKKELKGNYNIKIMLYDRIDSYPPQFRVMVEKNNKPIASSFLMNEKGLEYYYRYYRNDFGLFRYLLLQNDSEEPCIVITAPAQNNINGVGEAGITYHDGSKPEKSLRFFLSNADSKRLFEAVGKHIMKHKITKSTAKGSLTMDIGW